MEPDGLFHLPREKVDEGVIRLVGFEVHGDVLEGNCQLKNRPWLTQAVQLVFLGVKSDGPPEVVVEGLEKRRQSVVEGWTKSSLVHQSCVPLACRARE